MQRGYSLLMVIILLADHSVTVTFSVHSVRAVLEETVMLPCLVSDYKQTEFEKLKRIYWQTLENVPDSVHVYNDGKEESKDQSEKYKQRTKLFLDQLKNGNFSLQLVSIKVSDEKVYECYYQTDVVMKRVCKIHLQVAAYYKDPVLSHSQIDKNTEQFTCISKDGYPAPKVHWLFSNSEISADNYSTINVTQDPITELYSVVSIITVRSEKNISITCVIENERLQDNKSVAIYSKVFSYDPHPKSNATATVVAVVMVILTVTIASLATWQLRRRGIPFQRPRQHASQNSNYTYTNANNEEDTASVQ